MLSEIPFGSFLVYSPRGRSDISRKSQRIVNAVKTDKPGPLPGEAMINFTARRLRELNPPELAGFFGPTVTLVAAPKSSLMKPGTLWVPARICESLVSEGWGKEASRLVVRVKPVPKSAVATIRPDAQTHYESLAVHRELLSTPERITVVDDVITRGATLLGAVSRLKEAFPEADVRAFALIRTMSGEEVDAIVAPATGMIRALGGGLLQRDP